MHRIVFILFPGFSLLDFAGPVEVFHEARKMGMELEYSYAGTVPFLSCEERLTFSDLGPIPELRKGDWMIVPGYTIGTVDIPQSLADSMAASRAE